MKVLSSYGYAITVLYVLYSTVSAQLTNLLLENASQIDPIFTQKTMSHILDHLAMHKLLWLRSTILVSKWVIFPISYYYSYITVHHPLSHRTTHHLLFSTPHRILYDTDKDSSQLSNHLVY